MRNTAQLWLTSSLVLLLAACSGPREGQSGSEVLCTPGNAGDETCVQELGDGFACAADGVCAPIADADPPDAAPVSQASNTLFLNFAGETITSGADDSTTNTSFIVNGDPAVIPALSPLVFDATKTYQEVVDDITNATAALFAAFDVEVVSERPTSGPYVMVMVGGSSTDVGLPDNIMGVAPMDCADMNGQIEIAFVFTDGIQGAGDYGARVSMVATNAAQEVAHTFGLSHSTDCLDIMQPFAPTCGDKVFLDVDVACSNNSCECGGGPTQNSFEEMIGHLGPS